MKKSYSSKIRAVTAGLCICLSMLACTRLPGMHASAEMSELSVDPTGKSSGYSAVLYSNTNGLPTSEANTIAETSDGFIWIGSYSGLIRYDGNTFERIDSTSGITSVVELFVDSRDRLWIGTNDNGVLVMDKGEFRRYVKKDGLKSSTIRSIAEDENGIVYVGSTHGIVSVDENMEMHTVDEPQINEEYIRLLKAGKDGYIYGVTQEGAVFTIKDGKLTGFYEGAKLGMSDIRTLLPDMEKTGYVYIANKESKLLYGDLLNGFGNAETIDISPLGYVNRMANIGDTLWLCTDNGVGFVQDGRCEYLDNVPMNTSIESVITDYERNLWFASSQQGVMKIVPNKFEDVFEKYRLSDEVVYSTCLYNDMLLVGTRNNGLIVLKDGSVEDSIPVERSVSASGKTFDDKDLIAALEKSKIRSIMRDSKNRIWFCTFGECGLMRFDGSTLMRFTSEDGLPSERIRAVYESSDGRFMAACTGGLAIIDGDKVTEVYNEASGISNTEVLTVTENANGEAVVGTDGDGIYVISDSKVQHLGTESGLDSDVIMRIKKGRSSDVLWIVTSNSIAYMNSDNSITTIKNFPYSNNFDLYENSRGEMWVLSSNGIYVVPTAELIANGEISPVFYNRDNGLQRITTSNSYSELSESGNLYIAGTTGVVKVNIEGGSDDIGEIKTSIPYIDADGTRIYPDESGGFTVPANTMKLTVYCHVFNYSLINPYVSYKLDGFDQTETTVRRSSLDPITYTNLSGGNYRFVTHLKDSQGIEGGEYSVTITKQQAIHEMFWFRALMILLAAGVITAIFQFILHYRTVKFMKKDRENKLVIRGIVEAFSKVIDMKDKYTNGHSKRVAEYTVLLTRELGYDEDTVDKYYNIALLHDIGKIGVPEEILNKPGKLTDEEFAKIKSHSALGREVLKDISIMPELAIGAGSHHERPDGKGYPKGLKGDEIPRVAQIIAVADTFDAMYSNRPYRKRMNFEKVVSIIKEVSGTQLTEDVVEAFLRLVDKGEFRDPDDDGGGTTENIDNIHKKQNAEESPAE